MCTFQHTHAPWFSSNEPPRSIWSLLFKSPGLHNTPRIKVFQFSQKTLPKTLALAQTKRLNQHYKFLAEFQNTWQTKFKSRNITTPTISFLPLCPMSSDIKILFWIYLGKHLGSLRFSKCILPPFTKVTRNYKEQTALENQENLDASTWIQNICTKVAFLWATTQKPVLDFCGLLITDDCFKLIKICNGKGSFCLPMVWQNTSTLGIPKNMLFLPRGPEDIPVVSLFPKECLVLFWLPTHTLQRQKGDKTWEDSRAVKSPSPCLSEGGHQVSQLPEKHTAGATLNTGRGHHCDGAILPVYTCKYSLGQLDLVLLHSTYTRE